MAKFVAFIIFFVIGLLGGAYLKETSTTPTTFAFDTTGNVVQEIGNENINFLFSPLSSLGLTPLVLSCMLIVFLVFIIFLITKTFSTLLIASLGMAGGVSIFFLPIMGFIILGFGVLYSLIIEDLI